ncbi:DNA-binding protein [Nonomuraea sp. MG754425]|uniref:bifunctional MaoC family dehydratase N-terminal/OB-fold nucleic acid binding domain-containing protein n=1 Tax=Nonomuraea sp. MG754425 TaxID=2570319 RepID=UPI001F3397FE|nr:bifunctional MaoC family dehydratase N-terminal/OB-fold nucleic acid binding domain-containing protein [Nonomuraea sp. MG754425]MCF6472267.1 DNA-binding protein [Nonomuraea sp. MG754425]
MSERTGTGALTDGELHELAGKQAALGEVRGAPAADPVNVPMIRHWLTAMGDEHPRYLEQGLAPPAMAQVWTMPGLRHGPKDRSPVDDMMIALDGNGYTGVVATNCEQTYHRYVRVGERLTPATRFSGLAGPKRTALGVGFFATWNITWYSEDDEPVAEMMFRVLKFRPPAKVAERPPYPLQPAVNQDTEFFWDGVGRGELRIQSCADCGELRHPPGPLCPRCRSAERAYRLASGTGSLFSYVVHHHPPVPGRRTPFVVGVVELPEGVRMVGNVVDCPVEEVRIGMPLRVTYRRMDDRLVLPVWAPEQP